MPQKVNILQIHYAQKVAETKLFSKASSFYFGILWKVFFLFIFCTKLCKIYFSCCLIFSKCNRTLKIKILDKKWSLGSLKTIKYIKNETRLFSVCTWGIMKNCNIPHTLSTDVSGTQLSTLTRSRINNAERPEKYNKTVVKYEQIFTAATRHLTPAVIL
jgi:hypothetical protein